MNAHSLARRASAGAFLGFAWGAALRAWMVLLALQFGERPQFSWLGTFGGVLLPGALMGAILGAACDPAKTIAKKRWLDTSAILSPLLLVIGPALATENFITTLVTTGMGGGAFIVAAIGMLGGYAFSGAGSVWLRRVSGFLALGFTLAFGIGNASGLGIKSTASAPHKAFTGLLFVLLMIVLIAGVGAPMRYRSK